VAIGDRTGGRFVVDVEPPDFSSRDCRVVTLWGSRVRAWILHTEGRYEGGGQRVERDAHHFGLGFGRKPKTPTRALNLPCSMKAHASCERTPCLLHNTLHCTVYSDPRGMGAAQAARVIQQGLQRARNEATPA
jgi:hypothetical protein